MEEPTAAPVDVAPASVVDAPTSAAAEVSAPAAVQEVPAAVAAAVAPVETAVGFVPWLLFLSLSISLFCLFGITLTHGMSRLVSTPLHSTVVEITLDIPTTCDYLRL